MTLADDFIEAGRRAPARAEFDGYRRIAEILKHAQFFHITDEPRDAVHNLLTSRPSSLLSVMRYARLPFPVTWLEWTPPQGGKMAPGQLPVKRTAALLRQHGDAIHMVVMWSHHSPPPVPFTLTREMREFAELINHLGVSMLECAFSLNKPLESHGWFHLKMASDTMEGLLEVRDDRTNAVRYAIKDPAELEALRTIDRSLSFRVNHEMIHKEVIAASVSNREMIAGLISDIADDVGPVMALLILMNARNCVDLVHHPIPPKLNKARVKRQQSPLVNYSTVHIKLSRSDQRAAADSGADPHDIRRHIVRGHFKLRSSGVYWWRPHIRGTEGVVQRRGYEVE